MRLFSAENVKNERVKVPNVAKIVAAKLTNDTKIATVTLQANNRMKWEHVAWQPDIEVDGEIESWRPERTQNKRIRWFMAQVVPALVKSHREGEFTFSELEQAFDAALSKFG